MHVVPTTRANNDESAEIIRRAQLFKLTSIQKIILKNVSATPRKIDDQKHLFVFVLSTRWRDSSRIFPIRRPSQKNCVSRLRDVAQILFGRPRKRIDARRSSIDLMSTIRRRIVKCSR